MLVQRGILDNFVDEILERFVAYLKRDTSYLTGQVVKAKQNTSLYMNLFASHQHVTKFVCISSGLIIFVVDVGAYLPSTTVWIIVCRHLL